MMLFKMLILVCSVALPHADCQPNTALDVIQGPEVANELMCGFQGQAYLATTALGVHLGRNEYLKIKCSRTTIGSSVG